MEISKKDKSEIHKRVIEFQKINKNIQDLENELKIISSKLNENIKVLNEKRIDSEIFLKNIQDTYKLSNEELNNILTQQ